MKTTLQGATHSVCAKMKALRLILMAIGLALAPNPQTFALNIAENTPLSLVVSMNGGKYTRTVTLSYANGQWTGEIPAAFNGSSFFYATDGTNYFYANKYSLRDDGRYSILDGKLVFPFNTSTEKVEEVINKYGANAPYSIEDFKEEKVYSAACKIDGEVLKVEMTKTDKPVPAPEYPDEMTFIQYIGGKTDYRFVRKRTLTRQEDGTWMGYVPVTLGQTYFQIQTGVGLDFASKPETHDDKTAPMPKYHQMSFMVEPEGWYNNALSWTANEQAIYRRKVVVTPNGTTEMKVELTECPEELALVKDHYFLCVKPAEGESYNVELKNNSGIFAATGLELGKGDAAYIYMTGADGTTPLYVMYTDKAQTGEDRMTFANSYEVDADHGPFPSSNHRLWRNYSEDADRLYIDIPEDNSYSFSLFPAVNDNGQYFMSLCLAKPNVAQTDPRIALYRPAAEGEKPERLDYEFTYQSYLQLTSTTVRLEKGQSIQIWRMDDPTVWEGSGLVTDTEIKVSEDGSKGQFTAPEAGDYRIIVNINKEVEGKTYPFALTIEKAPEYPDNLYLVTCLDGKTVNDCQKITPDPTRPGLYKSADIKIYDKSTMVFSTLEVEKGSAFFPNTISFYGRTFSPVSVRPYFTSGKVVAMEYAETLGEKSAQPWVVDNSKVVGKLTNEVQFDVIEGEEYGIDEISVDISNPNLAFFKWGDPVGYNGTDFYLTAGSNPTLKGNAPITKNEKYKFVYHPSTGLYTLTLDKFWGNFVISGPDTNNSFFSLPGSNLIGNVGEPVDIYASVNRNGTQVPDGEASGGDLLIVDPTIASGTVNLGGRYVNLYENITFVLDADNKRLWIQSDKTPIEEVEDPRAPVDLIIVKKASDEKLIFVDSKEMIYDGALNKYKATVDPADYSDHRFTQRYKQAGNYAEELYKNEALYYFFAENYYDGKRGYYTDMADILRRTVHFFPDKAKLVTAEAQKVYETSCETTYDEKAPYCSGTHKDHCHGLIFGIATGKDYLDEECFTTEPLEILRVLAEQDDQKKVNELIWDYSQLFAVAGDAPFTVHFDRTKEQPISYVTRPGKGAFLVMAKEGYLESLTNYNAEFDNENAAVVELNGNTREGAYESQFFGDGSTLPENVFFNNCRKNKTNIEFFFIGTTVKPATIREAITRSINFHGHSGQDFTFTAEDTKDLENRMQPYSTTKARSFLKINGAAPEAAAAKAVARDGEANQKLSHELQLYTLDNNTAAADRVYRFILQVKDGGDISYNPSFTGTNVHYGANMAIVESPTNELSGIDDAIGDGTEGADDTLAVMVDGRSISLASGSAFSVYDVAGHTLATSVTSFTAPAPGIYLVSDGTASASIAVN